MSQLTLRNIQKSFAKTHVINGVDLDIKAGEFVVFVGPSGCGKSTLLRLIAGLESLSGGQIHIGDNDVSHQAPSQRGVAMVFQSYALFPHMSVEENLSFGLRLAKTSKSVIDQKVSEVAETLQITALLERKPKQLSGGQRQRVAIGRALVRNPQVFLFDEPLSNLDAALRMQMRIEIARLHKEIGATMIYVTHDQIEAMTLADKIVVLNQGKVEQVGSPLTLYNQPANQFVASFIGSPKMNMLPASFCGPQAQGATLRVGKRLVNVSQLPKAREGQSVTLGLRPESLSLKTDAQENSLPCRVVMTEHHGDVLLAHVNSPSSEELLTIKLPRETELRPGDTRHIAINPEQCHLFNHEGVAI